MEPMGPNIIQFISIQFNQFQFISIKFNPIQFISIQFKSIQFISIQFNSCQFNWFQFNSIRFDSIQFDAFQLISIHFNSFQFNSIQFNTWWAPVWSGHDWEHWNIGKNVGVLHSACDFCQPGGSSTSGPSGIGRSHWDLGLLHRVSLLRASGSV